MFSLLLRLQMLKIFVPECTGWLRQMGVIVVTIKLLVVVLQQSILVGWDRNVTTNKLIAWWEYFLFSLVALRGNMSHVTCHDVSRC